MLPLGSSRTCIMHFEELNPFMRIFVSLLAKRPCIPTRGKSISQCQTLGWQHKQEMYSVADMLSQAADTEQFI